jgi:hypothetical protein
LSFLIIVLAGEIVDPLDGQISLSIGIALRVDETLNKGVPNVSELEE